MGEALQSSTNAASLPVLTHAAHHRSNRGFTTLTSTPPNGNLTLSTVTLDGNSESPSAREQKVRSTNHHLYHRCLGYGKIGDTRSRLTYHMIIFFIIRC
jgi:hypothetical protein